jgi:hypothetical protein
MECPVRPTTVHATFGGGFFDFAALNLDELLEFAFFISTPSLTLLHATCVQTHSIGIAFPDKHMSSMSHPWIRQLSRVASLPAPVRVTIL